MRKGEGKKDNNVKNKNSEGKGEGKIGDDVKNEKKTTQKEPKKIDLEELSYSYSAVLNERDYLKEELGRKRENEILSFFTNFINLFSTVLSLKEGILKTEEILPTIQSQIKQSLTRVGIQTYEAKTGDKLDVSIHQIIGKVPTQDKSQINTVANSFGVGFKKKETIISRIPVTSFVEKTVEGGGINNNKK